MPISNARHARARTVAVIVATAIALLILEAVQEGARSSGRPRRHRQSGAYEVSANNPSGRFYAVATMRVGGATGPVAA